MAWGKDKKGKRATRLLAHQRGGPDKISAREVLHRSWPHRHRPSHYLDLDRGPAPLPPAGKNTNTLNPAAARRAD